MAYLNHLFLIIPLGLLPSFIWLLFFLKKDVHPEPKAMVLKIFLYGMLSVLPILVFVFLLEAFGLLRVIAEFLALSAFILIFYIFFWAAIEEILKYLVVRYKVLRSSELDEPVDAMLYMIIAGLGFAAFENILILFGVHPFLQLPEILFLITLRFVGATFLHALCSGVIGYFLALSFFETKKRQWFLFAGLGIATLLHGFYNFFIMKTEGNLRIWAVIIILLGLAIFVSFGFQRLKKLKSVCEM